LSGLELDGDAKIVNAAVKAEALGPKAKAIKFGLKAPRVSPHH